MLLILVAAVTLLVAVVVSARVNDDRNELATSWRGRQLTPPRSRPDFALTDTSGQPFDFRERTAGGLTFLFFGYTNCPDLCPTHMATLTGALRNAPDRRATVVFVTTDPSRDTPETLREWLKAFGGDVIGLTGTPQQIGVAQTAAGITSPSGTVPDSDNGYSVVHASQAIMYTPDNLAHLEYPFGTTQADWTADLELLATRSDWTRR